MTWENLVDFKKGKLIKEHFDRDVPWELSQQWKTVQNSLEEYKEEET